MLKNCAMLHVQNLLLKGASLSDTGNISLQLVPQHCCFASCKALLPVLPPPQATCRATNFSVASCINMLPKVKLVLREELQGIVTRIT